MCTARSALRAPSANVRHRCSARVDAWLPRYPTQLHRSTRASSHSHETIYHPNSRQNASGPRRRRHQPHKLSHRPGASHRQSHGDRVTVVRGSLPCPKCASHSHSTGQDRSGWVHHTSCAESVIVRRQTLSNPVCDRPQPHATLNLGATQLLEPPDVRPPSFTLERTSSQTRSHAEFMTAERARCGGPTSCVAPATPSSSPPASAHRPRQRRGSQRRRRVRPPHPSSCSATAWQSRTPRPPGCHAEEKLPLGVRLPWYEHRTQPAKPARCPSPSIPNRIRPRQRALKPPARPRTQGDHVNRGLPAQAAMSCDPRPASMNDR